MMEELHKCRCCGEAGFVFSTNKAADTWQTACSNAACKITGPIGSTRLDAIARWNLLMDDVVIRNLQNVIQTVQRNYEVWVDAKDSEIEGLRYELEDACAENRKLQSTVERLEAELRMYRLSLEYVPRLEGVLRKLGLLEEQKDV